MESAHREGAVYEADPDAEDLRNQRRRVPSGRCAACRAAWPCLAERMLRISRAALAGAGVPE